MAGALVFEAVGAKVGVWPTVLVGALLALAADCGANYTHDDYPIEILQLVEAIGQHFEQRSARATTRPARRLP
jgi:hypothetical protein